MDKTTNYKQRLKNINTFVFDVDGVLSDGIVILDPSGEMVRTMNTRDGYAIQYAVKKGYNVCIITGGNSEMVKTRMHYLGVDDVYLRASNKIKILDEYCAEKGISYENILYMGDDIPDYECIKKVGVGTCPHDAAVEIRAAADYISQIDGGMGCVRDVMEQTLRERGDWFTEDSLEW